MPGIIEDAAAASGLDPDLLARIAQIESGGNPRAQTGSYKGLFQLSNEEFGKYGSGDIFDTRANAMAGAAKIAAEAASFKDQYGRDPTPTEIYLIHQQGPAGFAAHASNPDQPAWQSMASTGEGRQKGAGWAKQAIWGNIPDQYKSQFGDVNNVTSAQFMDLWRRRVEGQNAPALALNAIPQGVAGQSQPGINAAALGAQSSPAGVPLFGGQQQQPTPETPQQFAQPDPLTIQFMQLRQRPNYAALQRMIAAPKGYS